MKKKQAKERIFSLRNQAQLDPKTPVQEHNGKIGPKENVRVFPLFIGPK